MFKLIVLLITFYATFPECAVGETYEAWTSSGYHLFISDNGTPDDPEDDWVYDWEDNREYEVLVLDE